MPSTRVRAVLIVILILLIFSVLSLFFWDFIRDSIVVPLYYMLWVIGLFLRSIPQGAYLALILLIGLYLSLNTLDQMRVKQPKGGGERPRPQSETRYGHWRRACRSLYGNRFARTQFNSEARRLVVSLLAYEHGIDPTDAEAGIKDGTLAVPATISALFERRELQSEALSTSFVDRLLQRLRLQPAKPATDPQLDQLLTDVVNFVEQSVRPSVKPSVKPSDRQHTEHPYGGNQLES